MGQIERPARGFYAPAPANPVFRRKATAATPLTPEEEEAELERWVQEAVEEIKADMRARANAAATPSDKSGVSPEWIRLTQALRADKELQQLHAAERARELSAAATTTPNPEPATSLAIIATTTPNPEPATSLASTAATTPNPEPATSLASTAATTPNPQPTSSLNLTIAMTPEEIRERAWRQTCMDEPYPQGAWRKLSLDEPYSPYEEMQRRDSYWQIR
jgi:hypothetical protein